MDDIRGKYQHFKGGIYEVIGEGKHTETGEHLVFYTALYDDEAKNIHVGDMFARPYDMFFSEVDYDKYPHIKRGTMRMTKL